MVAAIMVAAWTWRLEAERRLIIVNLSDLRSQALLPLPWEDMPGHPCQLTDPFTNETYTRAAQNLHHPGLFVDLDPWQFHFFRVA